MTMNENEQQIEQVELTIEQAKASIELMRQLKVLSRNKEFEAIIHKGYFEKEASRLVLLRADDTMQDEISQTIINNQMIAIGYVRKYFNSIMQMGSMAEGAISSHEETLEELSNEGVQ